MENSIAFQNTIQCAKGRNRAIDFMKGIITLFMILAHIIQFFPAGRALDVFSGYVNLTTFSGFLFAFGFSSDLAYISSPRTSSELRRRLFYHFLKATAAYYVSAISFSALIGNDLSFHSLLQILVFRRIPGYSEFLLSFALIYPVLCFMRRFFAHMDVRSYCLFVIVSILATFLPYYEISEPVIGALIGCTSFFCFPLLQYSSYYFTGVYCSQKKVVFSKPIFLASLTGALALLHFFSNNGCMPGRFPPTAVWIVGGYLAVYCYYLASCWITARLDHPITRFVQRIGQDTLLYLLFSNCLIFAVWRINVSYGPIISTHRPFFIHIVLFPTCIGVPYLIAKWKRKI